MDVAAEGDRCIFTYLESDKLSKSWPHLLLGGTLIDTHSSVLTGVVHSVLCDTFFHPFLDFAHTVMDNTTIMKMCCACDGHFVSNSQTRVGLKRHLRIASGTGASHLQTIMSLLGSLQAHRRSISSFPLHPINSTPTQCMRSPISQWGSRSSVPFLPL